MRIKIRTYGEYGDKVHISFCGLNELGGCVECAFFTFISVDSFLVYQKKNITCKYIY